MATFTVTRSGGTAAFDVNFATSNGTATVADGDYVAASNTLHFGANQNTQTISVTINGDTKVEANETFNVLLSNATNGATISDSQGVGTITNDDVAVIAGSVSINDVTISEGDSGTKVATFTVTRSGGTAAFDVNFATSNGDRHCRRQRLCRGLQHAAFRSQREHADDLGHDQRRHQGRGERDLQRRSVKCDQRRHHQRQSRCRHHHQR